VRVNWLVWTSFSATPSFLSSSSSVFIRTLASALAASAVLAVSRTPVWTMATSGFTETLPSAETPRVRGAGGAAEVGAAAQAGRDRAAAAMRAKAARVFMAWAPVERGHPF